MFAKPAKIFVPLAAILFIGILWFGIRWYHFLNSPMVAPNSVAVEFVLESGTSVKALAAELQQQGVLTHPELFILWARVTGQTRNLQAGEYRIDPGSTPRELLDKLSSGEVILYAFTIVPGWTFHQLVTALEADPNVAHNLRNLSATQIMQRIGHPDQHPEGLFFPDTYKFHANFSDTKILLLAYTKMQLQLQQMWQNRDKKVPYKNSYKALVVASIIEKETALTNERFAISGIIIRRLHKHMYLQLDPTVIYGIGKNYAGDLTTKDLRKDTPYNTYIHKGLPPTPICMPGTTSIYAVLHPERSKMLYFVAKGDGSHVFSATLKEHNVAVKKYRLEKNNQVIPRLDRGIQETMLKQ